MAKKRTKVPLTLCDLYQSFPCLVWETIRDDLEPTILYAAKKAGIDHGTLRKWISGRTRSPEPHLVVRYAAAYGFDLDEVLALTARDAARLAKGEGIKVPDLSHLRRGPHPDPNSKRSKRRLRLVRPIRGGSGAVLPLPLEEACEDEDVAIPPGVVHDEKDQQIRDIMSNRRLARARRVHLPTPASSVARLAHAA